MGPLNGLRVLDMTTVLMGPYATLQLGDMGADVIKVEPLKATRTPDRSGPAPGNGGDAHQRQSQQAEHHLDLKQAAGRQLLLRLAATSDVFIYNVRPQAMARLGLAYEDLASSNPAIIYAGVFGYGQDGPLCRAAGLRRFDSRCLRHSHAARASRRRGSPRYAPLTIADRIVGLFAVNAILAALRHRDVTGRGQRIDVPMFETMANFVLIDHLGGLTFDPPLDRGGYARLLAPERGPYRTKDGHICALIYNDKQWRSFFHAIERPDMLQDPRFRDHSSRTRHVREIYAEVAAIFTTRTTADWISLLEWADLPYTPLRSIDDLIEDPHLAETGFFAHVEHPTEGKIKSMRAPTAWSDSSKAPPHRPAPALGEHSREILEELGLPQGLDRRLVRKTHRSRPGGGSAGARKPGTALMDFALTSEQRAIARRGAPPVRALRRRLLAEEGSRRRLSRTISIAPSPRPAGSASRCRRSTAAPASASPRPRS